MEFMGGNNLPRIKAKTATPIDATDPKIGTTSRITTNGCN